MTITYERKIEVVDEDTGMVYWKHDDVTDLVNDVKDASRYCLSYLHPSSAHHIELDRALGRLCAAPS